LQLSPASYDDRCSRNALYRQCSITSCSNNPACSADSPPVSDTVEDMLIIGEALQIIAGTVALGIGQHMFVYGQRGMWEEKRKEENSKKKSIGIA